MRDLFELRGRDWVQLPKSLRDAALERAFFYWRLQGFPYYSLKEDEISKEFRRLCAHFPQKVLTRHHLGGSVLGLRLANNFHPQMWAVRVSRYRSPMEVFNNDELLKAALQRSWQIWPDRFGARASSLRRMLKSFPGTASVSNFRPTAAKAIVRRFSKPGDTVLDFASGYGGRMLGCLSELRNYIGVDPCREQARGLKQTIKALASTGFLGAKAAIHYGCAEDVLPTLPGRSVALVFSSPPYYDWERYSNHSSQSFLRHPSYEAWVSGFLERAIEQSHRILQKGGFLVLNISGRHRKPSRREVQTLARAYDFLFVRAISMRLARIPYLHPRKSGPFKPELLLVFAKR